MVNMLAVQVRCDILNVLPLCRQFIRNLPQHMPADKGRNYIQILPIRRICIFQCQFVHHIPADIGQNALYIP